MQLSVLHFFHLRRAFLITTRSVLWRLMTPVLLGATDHIVTPPT